MKPDLFLNAVRSAHSRIQNGQAPFDSELTYPETMAETSRSLNAMLVAPSASSKAFYPLPSDSEILPCF